MIFPIIKFMLSRVIEFRSTNYPQNGRILVNWLDALHWPYYTGIPENWLAIDYRMRNP